MLTPRTRVMRVVSLLSPQRLTPLSRYLSLGRKFLPLSPKQKQHAPCVFVS